MQEEYIQTIEKLGNMTARKLGSKGVFKNQLAMVEKVLEKEVANMESLLDGQDLHRSNKP